MRLAAVPGWAAAGNAGWVGKQTGRPAGLDMHLLFNFSFTSFPNFIL